MTESVSAVGLPGVSSRAELLGRADLVDVLTRVDMRAADVRGAEVVGVPSAEYGGARIASGNGALVGSVRLDNRLKEVVMALLDGGSSRCRRTYRRSAGGHRAGAVSEVGQGAIDVGEALVEE
jgi:hypothetical protein